MKSQQGHVLSSTVGTHQTTKPSTKEAEDHQVKKKQLRRLKKLFRSLQLMKNSRRKGAKRKATMQEIVDEVLSRYPAFCLKHFEVLDDEEEWDMEDDSDMESYPPPRRFTPLSLLLILEADFHVIEKVCDLNPRALLDCNGTYNLCPLQIAVARAETTPQHARVISFLARKCPDALKRQDEHGRYPVDLALNPTPVIDMRVPNCNNLRNYYREAIAPLIELFPDPLDGYRDMYGDSPLGLAIQWDLGAKAIRSLVERIPKSRDSLILYPVPRSNLSDGIPIDLACAKELVMLLPQLKTLTLFCHGWTKEGLNFFLQHLKANTTNITKLQLSLPFYLVCLSSQLRELLHMCCCGLNQLVLKQCLWEGEVPREERVNVHHEEILRAVASGPKPMEELKIFSLKLSTASSFMRFLSSGKAPRHLKIGIQFLSTEPVLNDDYNPTISPNSSVESLALGVYPSNGQADETVNECLQSVMYQLTKLPHLKELDLYLRPAAQRGKLCPKVLGSVDCLIATAPSLRSLTLRNFNRTANSTINALRRNEKLKSLTLSTQVEGAEYAGLLGGFQDLLENHNATLTDLQICKGDRSRPGLQHQPLPPSVRYLLALNEMGRSHARNPSTSMSRFVNLLSRVPADKEQKSVLYGLLREMPGLWC